jgi:hypothetical protein
MHIEDKDELIHEISNLLASERKLDLEEVLKHIEEQIKSLKRSDLILEKRE